MSPLDQVIRYHEETKHQFSRYAKSLGYLDWANQPNPFRRYIGAPLIPLPILKPEDGPRSPAYRDLYHPGKIASAQLSLHSLSRFLEYALALTAWKQAGSSRWALRSNPSSGNLHPTEGYVLAGPVAGLAPHPALYHYAPKEHGLELRAGCEQAAFAELMRPFPPGAFLLAFTSILWREAWKYGERAFRYCQHDVGHAIGTARLGAAALGWRMVVLEGTGDDAIASLLGLTREADYADAERERPDCVAVIWPDTTAPGDALPLCIRPQTVERLVVQWHGRANRLSADDPVPWEIIDEVARATRKPAIPELCLRTLATARELQHAAGPCADDASLLSKDLSAGQVIHQRRSALAFDGKTSISAQGFYAMLRRLMPYPECDLTQRPIPWDTWIWEPCVFLAIFVHRVEGLVPGLYSLIRDPMQLPTLRNAMHGRFVWSRPPDCPADLPLFLLEEGDARRVAIQVSCHQDIAGDSAFSLGMVAEFEGALQRHGPWFYRRLFWETGLIGQVLYLEAEAAGVRATGIGCFFDDPMHQVLGLGDRAYQSLYHFTTGGHVEDPRLTTLPPYGPQEPFEEARLSFP